MKAPTSGDCRPVAVHQRRLVRLDATSAGAALERYVATLGAGDDRGVLRLRTPVWLPNLSAEIELHDDATISLHPAAGDDGAACVDVRWFGSGQQSFPQLDGSLWIAPATPETSWLCFDASYLPMAPTLRLAAPAERIVGHRIVLATMRRLLQTAASAIEDRP